MGNTARQADMIAKEIGCAAPNARNVFLAGTFNDWSESSTPMKKGIEGSWSVNLHLSPGHHEFKFVIDGKWCCAPGCEDTAHPECRDCVVNSFGTMNRVLNVE